MALGGELLKLKRYDGAAKAYEQGVELDEKNAYYALYVGAAYAKSGNGAKALEAFHKAVQLKPDDSILNDAGYDMADNNLNLPEALDYTRRAVGMVIDDLNKLDPESLSVEDLRNTQKLGMYWDSLTWAHYRMGGGGIRRSLMEAGAGSHGRGAFGGDPARAKQKPSSPGSFSHGTSRQHVASK